MLWCRDPRRNGGWLLQDKNAMRAEHSMLVLSDVLNASRPDSVS